MLVSRQMSKSSSVSTTNACMCAADHMKCVCRALVDRFSTRIVSLNFLLKPVIYIVHAYSGQLVVGDMSTSFSLQSLTKYSRFFDSLQMREVCTWSRCAVHIFSVHSHQGGENVYV
jgi:hypothetical protein